MRLKKATSAAKSTPQVLGGTEGRRDATEVFETALEFGERAERLRGLFGECEHEEGRADAGGRAKSHGPSQRPGLEDG